MRTAVLRQRGRVLVPVVLVADRAVERMRGLLGRDSLGEGTGMLLAPCHAIHTLGMRFALDVVFFDAAMRPVRVVRGLKPCRLCLGGFRARCVLELQGGWFDVSALEAGVPAELD